MDGTLVGRTVVVTGGTQGIGAAITRTFLEQGARVAALYRSDDENAARFRQALPDAGRLLTLRADVADRGAVQDAFAEVTARLGCVSVLVNNAGVQSPRACFEEQAPDTWTEVFASNVYGTIWPTQAVLPQMKQQQWGRIVNVSSVAATEGYPNCSPYAASKATLLGLTRSLAKEAAPYAITVNAILPGITDTRAARGLPGDVFGQLLSILPMRRCANTCEVAALACFLATDAASYISGACIPITGAR